jgi:HlyD family secretion protein
MRKRVTNYLVFLLLGGILTLTACMPVQENSSPTIQIDEIGELGLLIEGCIVPQQWIGLSFPGSGLVEDIYFNPGESVQAGEVIARLGGQAQLTSTLAVAELELLTARQAYDALAENHALAKAQVLTDRIALQQAIASAEIGLENLKNRDLVKEIESAKASIVLLEDKLKKAQELYDDYQDSSDTNLNKAQARINLSNAQQQLEEGLALLNSLENRDLDLDIEKAESDLALLKVQLNQAAKREADLQDGPIPDELAIAQQRLTAAQAGVEAAQAALDSLTLVAPFNGVIFDNSLKVGQFILTGQQAVILADTSQWLVETNDLTEIDRAKVSLGQAVTVTLDALPELNLEGVVLRISDYYQENRGDITYKTYISLKPTDADLHWGMTVLINFGAD